MKRIDIFLYDSQVRIEKASAGYNSGIIGAAAVWR